MKKTRSKRQFAVCIENTGYLASLELRKLYELVPDSEASTYGMVRIVDESGEDYLYPAEFFAPVRLPKAAGKAFVPST